MFKSYFLMQPGIAEPFRYRGADANEAVINLFPEITGYVQSRAIGDQGAFSGAAELWFATPEAAINAIQTGSGPLMVDDAIVHSTLAGMERVVVRRPEYLTLARIKGVYPFCRKEDMPLRDFQNHWWHNHGPIAALTEEALSYVQIHPMMSCYENQSPAFDGITEIAWVNEEAAARAINSRQMREDQGGDAPNFVKTGSVALFLATEEIIIAP